MAQLEKSLYTAKTHTMGGPDGASRRSDRRLDVKLSSPGAAATGLEGTSSRNANPVLSERSTTMFAEATAPARLDMKLEVVMLGVADVDRAKAFYENLGWRLDADFVTGDDFRVVQMTPHNSGASIIFGKGVTSAKPGSAGSLVLAVDDIDAARDDLSARGVNVSEVFHYAGGPFNNAVENPRVGGRDPQGRSYFSFASFEDPDGNSWLLQEIQTRLPGREWKLTQSRTLDVATLAELLRETAEHHHPYEKTHAAHHWWDWYAPYVSARQNGSSPEEAAAAASGALGGDDS